RAVRDGSRVRLYPGSGGPTTRLLPGTAERHRATGGADGRTLGASGRLLRLAGDRVDDDGRQQHATGDHVLHRGGDALQGEAVLDGHDDHHTEQGVPRAAAATEEGRTADDGGGDDVHQELTGARALVGGGDLRGHEETADGGEGTGDREHRDPDQLHVDAGAPGGLDAAAEREDLAAVGGAAQDEVREHQEGQEDHDGQREALVLAAHDRDDEGQDREQRGPHDDLVQRTGRHPGGLAAAVVGEGQQEVAGRHHDRQAVGGGHVGEVVAGQLDDQAVGVEVDRAVAAEDLQHEALPEEQAGQGHGEGGHADAGEEEAVDGAGRGAGEDRQHERQDLVHPVGDAEHREGGARDTADRADRQVDLAEQQDEHDADGDHAGADHGDRHVGEVAGGEEVAVQAGEDGPDDQQADDDRNGPEVTGLHLALELAEIAREALLAHQQPGVDHGHRGGGRLGVLDGVGLGGGGLVGAHFLISPLVRAAR